LSGADSPFAEVRSPSTKLRASNRLSTDNAGSSEMLAFAAASSVIQAGIKQSVSSGWIIVKCPTPP
jgi:hypothetical protein